MSLQQLHTVKRQLEILGLCLHNALGLPLDIPNLALFFNVEEITIKRDLKELRSQGIDIHSQGKKGVAVSNMHDPFEIRKFMLQYVGLNYTENIFDRSTSLILEKKASRAFAEMIALQICVDKQLQAKIVYQGLGRVIKPILIFHSDDSWRVLSQEGEPVKQFHFDKIESVRILNETFTRMSAHAFEELYRYSFGSWIGVERYLINIKFTSVWGERIKNRRLAANQEISMQKDGTILFSAIVNNLAEVARWVVGMGYGCEVMEPVELKQMVIELAQESLKNYLFSN